jgi:peroxiredoxin/outer membrane lipoprotein-sorting protein
MATRAPRVTLVLVPFVSLAALIVLPARPASAQIADEARVILEQVARTYSSLQTGRLQGLSSTEVVAPEHGAPGTPRPFTISFHRPDLARLEGSGEPGGMVIVVDGERTWDYVASYGQYIRDRKSWSLASSEVGRYGRLLDGASRARILWQEDVDFDGRAVPCDVVEVNYEGSDSPMARASGTFWVDRARRWILREVAMLRGRDPDGTGVVEIVERTAWTSIEANPDLPDSLFRFVPRTGDSEVSEFFDPALRGFVGEAAPDFAGSDQSGEPVALSGFRGRVVVLAFWTTWCQECLSGLKTLDRLRAEGAEKALTVLGIGPEPPGRVQAFLDEQGLTVRTVNDRDGALARLYRIRALPTAIVIDRDGKVASHVERPRGEAEWRTILRSAGLPDTAPAR